MCFSRRDGELHAGEVPLSRIADAVGTPAYVYSWNGIRDRYRQVERAPRRHSPPHLLRGKGHGSLSVLARLAALGAGFDIVSGGELERVLRAGGDPARVVFSGVGKSEIDIDFAIKCGIHTFNVESASELRRIEARARLLGSRARISVRVNPDVDAKTHPYISTGRKENKFGVPAAEARRLYRLAAASKVLEVVGVDCHIGSQIGEVGPFRDALTALTNLADVLLRDGIALGHVDIGGGFGVVYRDEPPLHLDALGRALRDGLGSRGLELLVEPGRFLVADAGVLLTRVEYLKPAPGRGHRNFAVVDAAMNDLIRPALYQAWHGVEPVTDSRACPARWDVVGPVCETGDFLALWTASSPSRPARCWPCAASAPTASCRAPTTIPALARRRCWWTAPTSPWPASARPWAICCASRASYDCAVSRRTAPMKLRFAKMHGLGNDFMLVDLITPARGAVRRAHPRLGRSAHGHRLRPVPGRAAAGRPGGGLPLPHLQRRRQRGGAVRQRRALRRPLRGGSGTDRQAQPRTANGLPHRPHGASGRRRGSGGHGGAEHRAGNRAVHRRNHGSGPYPAS